MRVEKLSRRPEKKQRKTRFKLHESKIWFIGYLGLEKREMEVRPRAGWETIPFSTESRPPLRLTTLLSNGYRVARLLGVWRPGVKLTTHSHLVPRLRMSIAIHLLSKYVFIVWWLLTGHKNFIFTLYLFCVSFRCSHYPRLYSVQW